MRKGIHPPYYPNAEVVCVCGQTFTVGSTLPKIKVEICRGCHPFFTGQEKVLDIAGRVERFQKRKAQSEKRKAKS